MTTTWKIVIPVGLVVLIVAAVLWLRSPSSPPTAPAAPTAGTTEQATEPSPAISQAADQGSADAIVAELLEIAEAEATSFNEETADSSLISSDSAELNNLLTTYDSSQY